MYVDLGQYVMFRHINAHILEITKQIRSRRCCYGGNCSQEFI